MENLGFGNSARAIMVCDKCSVKLAKIVVPDVWKEGARNVTGGADGGRRVGGAPASHLVMRRSKEGRRWAARRAGPPPSVDASRAGVRASQDEPSRQRVPDLQGEGAGAHEFLPAVRVLEGFVRRGWDVRSSRLRRCARARADWPGICTMCGRKVAHTEFYKMSST